MSEHARLVDYLAQHVLWKTQVENLTISMSALSKTGPRNVLQHFFSQAVESELYNELDSTKTLIKGILINAISQCDTIQGSVRERAVKILKQTLHAPILENIRLADIRNRTVFEIYKRCGVTIDTYFDRYSSPPGSPDQNEAYANIAHGDAIANAETTELLACILLCMQILKRFFVVYDLTKLEKKDSTPFELNWLGTMWAWRVQNTSLGDLIWELFLDVWYYENINL